MDPKRCFEDWRFAVLKIHTGAVCVGHLCSLSEFAGRIGRALVDAYAHQADLDFHHAESCVVEVRALRQTAGAPKCYELRIGGTTVASAREEVRS